MSAAPEISDSKNLEAGGEREPKGESKLPDEHAVDGEPKEDSESERIQDGVKRVEAITQAWNYKALAITYSIYICSFVNSLKQQITTNLAIYVTSSFGQHSLIATTSVLSGVIGGVSRFVLAKIIDIWGRVEGIIFMALLCTLGLIMMAVAKNVETYAAAQVFYWVGYNNMGYAINVFLADMTTLQNRMILYGLNSTPFIATTFAGPAIAQLFYPESTIWWGFGCFAIILPVIAMLVLGLALLVVFVVYEKLWAPVTFMPYKYLKGRTVLGACLLSATLFVSFYCWDLYFSSYHGLNIRDSGYILNIYNIGSCFWGPFVGLLIRLSGRYKWLALVAIPVSMLAMSLLIHFRQPGTRIGYVVMCQILSAFAGGTLVMTEQLAAMAAVPHNEVAAVLALEGMFTSIGGAVGQSISGAIWTNLMPRKLAEYLPDADRASDAC